MAQISSAQNAIMTIHISPACHQAQPPPPQNIIVIISSGPGAVTGPLFAACLPMPPRGSDLGPGPRGRKALPPRGIGGAPWRPAGAGRGPGETQGRGNDRTLPEQSLVMAVRDLRPCAA